MRTKADWKSYRALMVVSVCLLLYSNPPVNTLSIAPSWLALAWEHPVKQCYIRVLSGFPQSSLSVCVQNSGVFFPSARFFRQQPQQGSEAEGHSQDSSSKKVIRLWIESVQEMNHPCWEFWVGFSIFFGRCTLLTRARAQSCRNAMGYGDLEQKHKERKTKVESHTKTKCFYKQAVLFFYWCSSNVIFWSMTETIKTQEPD